jgi:MFS family permease
MPRDEASASPGPPPLQSEAAPGAAAGLDQESRRAWHRALSVTFRALRHRNYRLYFFGQLVSLMGTWVQTTALGWLAYQYTGESKWPALIQVAQILPTFLLGAWGGMLADRVPKRTLIFGTQTAYMLLAFLLAGLDFAGVLTPWQMLAVTAAGGIVQALDLPARLAFVMDMAGREDLPNAVALNSVVFNTASALGPAVGGQLLNVLHPQGCFLINALSYLAVLWALAQMDISGAAKVGKEAGGLRTVLDGLNFILGRRNILLLVLLMATTSFCGWSIRALLPALAHQLGSDNSGYGWMMGGIGLGALAAAWTVATFGSVENRRRSIRAGICVVSAGLILLSISNNLPFAIASAAFTGFGLILFLATTQSIVQLSAGDHNRGRVMAIYAMVQSAAIPFGTILSGWAADHWGVSQVLMVLGISCFTAGVVLIGLFRLWKTKSAQPRAG